MIDIFPPKTRKNSLTASLQENDAQPPRSFSSILKTIGVLAFFAVAGGLASMHFFFANAQIVVIPRIEQLALEERVTGVFHKAAPNAEQKILPVELFIVEKEATRLYPSSGKKQKETHAEGMIRVYNENSSPQVLVANTRFISEDGKLFRSQDRVVVSAKRLENGKYVPGSTDVKVIAAEPGAEYNIGPSNFSLPGLVGSPLYSLIYGKSTQPTAGGVSQQAPVVLEDDIESARSSLLAALSKETIAELYKKIPQDFVLLEKSLETTTLSDSSLVKAGAELAQFNYNAKIETIAVGLNAQAGKALAMQFLEVRLADIQKIDEKTLVLAYDVKGPIDAQTNTVPIRVKISAHVFYTLDPVQLKTKLQGTPKEKIESVLAEFPHLATARVSLWPFWVRSIPRDPEKIHVMLSLD